MLLHFLLELDRSPPMHEMSPDQKRQLARQLESDLTVMERREKNRPAFGADLMEQIRRVMTTTTRRLRLRASAEEHRN